MAATEVKVDPEAGQQDPAAAKLDNQSESTIDETKISCLYFGYGSNLSPRTMKQRCPDSLFIGLAKLNKWRWMINETGYANIVPGMEDDEVYGSLCFLSRRDEAALDDSEGVPWLYQKVKLKVKRLVAPNIEGDEWGTEEGDGVEAVSYVDGERITEGKIEKEYVVWVRKAIEDGLKCGMPMGYVDRYLRRYLPEGDEPLRDVMMVRTVQFGEKSAGMVPRGFASWSRG